MILAIIKEVAYGTEENIEVTQERQRPCQDSNWAPSEHEQESVPPSQLFRSGRFA
jgi:hypothetical protein